jgi:hypothetical protein
MWTTSAHGMRELAQRSNNGIDVRLLWHVPSDQVFVVVEDTKGDSFELEVDAENALDAFRHPFIYADVYCDTPAFVG